MANPSVELWALITLVVTTVLGFIKSHLDYKRARQERIENAAALNKQLELQTEKVRIEMAAQTAFSNRNQATHAQELKKQIQENTNINVTALHEANSAKQLIREDRASFAAYHNEKLDEIQNSINAAKDVAATRAALREEHEEQLNKIESTTDQTLRVSHQIEGALRERET